MKLYMLFLGVLLTVQVYVVTHNLLATSDTLETSQLASHYQEEMQFDEIPLGDNGESEQNDIEQPTFEEPSAAMVLLRRIGIRLLYVFYDTKLWCAIKYSCLQRKFNTMLYTLS